MSLTLDYIRKNNPIDSGIIRSHHHFFGRGLFELDNGNFYLRKDNHLISTFGYRGGRLYAYFPNQNLQSEVESVNMIKSETIDFSGFEPGRKFRLRNGQIWEQVGGVNSNCSPGGIVVIKDRQLMQVGNWDWKIMVRLIKDSYL